MKNSRRNVVVFAALVSALTLTSVLLLAFSPPPLSADSASTLFAVDKEGAFSTVFQTKVPCQIGRWKYIFVHHSRTAGGDATSLGQMTPGGLGDHFLIGNGNGCGDGEIQMAERWGQQLSAGTVNNAACISICLVGDFDHSTPTSTQLQRLQQLVKSLQGRCGISADDVFVDDQPNSASAIGQYFPASAFRQQLNR